MGFLVSKRSMIGGNIGFVLPDYRMRTFAGYPGMLKKPLELKSLALYGNEGGVGDGDLPGDYVRLEYIESTGTQFIDTNIKANQDTRIVCKFSMSDMNSGAIFGSRDGTSSNAFTFQLLSSGYWGSAYDGVAAKNISLADKKIHVVDKTKNKTYIDEQLVDSVQYVSFVSAYPVKICTLGVGVSQSPARIKARIYYFKIYNGDIIIGDFVPAKRIGDESIGLYNILNGRFYTNEGSDNFIAGSEIYRVPILFNDKRVFVLNTTKKLSNCEESIIIDFKANNAKLRCSKTETDISNIQDWTQDFSLSEADELLVTTDTAAAPSRMEIKYKGKKG